MYVPIIIDPCAFYDYRYLWEYLKYLYHSYRNNWAIVSTREYENYREKHSISNAYEKKFAECHQYRVLEKTEEQTVKKYFIEESVFNGLENKIGSKLGTKIYLLKYRYRPLEKEIKRILRLIEKESGKKIEGILNWNAHFKSVRYVAEKMGIPVITSEFSIRFPDFYPLSYFCLKDIYEEQEIKKLFLRFQKEIKLLHIPLLTREEILCLFIHDSMLNKIDDFEKITPKYEIGVAGCHPLIATFFAKSTYTDLELIEDVRKAYSEDDILFRKHPGDEPYQARYTVKNLDNSVSVLDFILKCKRITAIGSNTLVEAMLLGKPIFSKTISPFTVFAEKNLLNKENGYVNEEILNFIFFVYFSPYNKIFDEDYITWRIKEQKTNKIYERNICYYFEQMNIKQEILYLNNNRYEAILKSRLENRNDQI